LLIVLAGERGKTESSVAIKGKKESKYPGEGGILYLDLGDGHMSRLM
jgi:hypothetical protein